MTNRPGITGRSDQNIEEVKPKPVVMQHFNKAHVFIRPGYPAV